MEFGTSGGGQEAEGSPRGSGAGGPGGGYNLSDPVDSFLATVRALVAQPAVFFRGLALRDALSNPIVFAVICAFIGAFLGGIVAILGAAAGIGQQGLGAAIGGFVAGIILGPLLTPVALFVAAGISHLFVMLFVRPSNSGFWATFRVASYVSVTSLVNWIPIIGGLVALVWGVVLSILGIREVHQTTTGRAALVVLVPVAIILLLLALVAASVLVAVFAGR